MENNYSPTPAPNTSKAYSGLHRIILTIYDLSYTFMYVHVGPNPAIQDFFRPQIAAGERKQEQQKIYRQSVQLALQALEKLIIVQICIFA